MRFLCWVLPALLLAVSPAAATTVNDLLRLWIPDRLEFCGEPVPLDRPDVLERLDLELVVALGDPVSAALWFKRAPRYLPIARQALAEAGLPADLQYVPVIESNLRPGAVSRAGAVGPWQFLRSTGRLYGLACKNGCDDRRDWEKATAAALAHLKDLHDAFGSWPLALAAYNAGRNRVASAMEAQGESSFYDLRLPRETERYVFRAMAAKLILEHPERYGIDLEGARTWEPPETREVTLRVDRRRLPVAAVADAAGVGYRRLVELNPWIVGTGLRKGTYRLVLPAEGTDGFAARLARWEEENPEPRRIYHRVKRGDTLSAIARRYGLTVGQICEWNGITPRTTIYPGQTLTLFLTD